MHKRMRIVCLMLVTSVFVSSCSKKSELDIGMVMPESKYELTEAVARTMGRLESNDFEKVPVYTSLDNGKKCVYLTFIGMIDRSTTEVILSLLKEYNAKATFMLPGIKAAEDPVTVETIKKQGQYIGSLALSDGIKINEMTKEEMIEDLTTSYEIAKKITNEAPSLLQCRASDYSANLITAASATGYAGLIDTDQFLSYQSFQSMEIAEKYVAGLKRGDIISVITDDVLNKYEFEATIIPEVSPSEDTPLIKDDEDKRKEPTERERLVLVTEYLLSALHASGYEVLPANQLISEEGVKTDWTEEREQNKGVLSKNMTQARTAVPNIGYAFTDLSSRGEVLALLDELEKKGTKATFFVTAYEMRDQEALIKEIIARGHEVENAGGSGKDLSDTDFNMVCEEIALGKKLLKDMFDIESKLFMPSGGKSSDTILEAASALETTVVTANKRPVNRYGTDKSKKELFTYFKLGFQRGDIVHFPMKSYEKLSKTVSIVTEIAEKIGYKAKTVGYLKGHEYPLLADKEIKGFDAIRINPKFNLKASLGKSFIESIKTSDKVLFFTFDDWGSDKTVNEILDVLDEYKVKATFFVRANGIVENKNLLRAIYERGHDVASHSYYHREITVIPDTELQKDAVMAHKEISRILCEAPRLYYRPPTLNFSKEALNSLKASGFTYIVSGRVSTHDYEKTPAQVADMVYSQAGKGSIIVMHMSDHSCAAKALKLMLPKLKKWGYSFPKLSDYLD